MKKASAIVIAIARVKRPHLAADRLGAELAANGRAGHPSIAHSRAQAAPTSSAKTSAPASASPYGRRSSLAHGGDCTRMSGGGGDGDGGGVLRATAMNDNSRRGVARLS
eukprot:6197106-Pleurochrysis_carterae.AAC.1